MNTRRLHSTERQELILKSVRERGAVTVPAMAAECRASGMTIRRDFDRLAEKGLLVRSHGGASLPNSPANGSIDLVEPSIDERTQRNREAKQAMARAALSLVHPSQTIALDVGTSSYELACLLAETPVRLFTTSLKIASRLSRSRPRVYVPGGEIHGTEPSIIGSRATEEINRLLFDVAFIGVSGITAEGLYDYSLEDTEVKWSWIDRSRKTVALIDSSKFERRSVAQIAALKALDLLITERKPPPQLYDALMEAGVEVQIAT